MLVGNKSVLLEFGSGSQDIHRARKQETRVSSIDILNYFSAISSKSYTSYSTAVQITASINIDVAGTRRRARLAGYGLELLIM